MRDSHEACEGRSTEDSVVLRRPIHHFKLDPFPPIVVLRPKDDFETNFPQWNLWLAWDDAVERCIGSFEIGQGYVHGSQRGGEDEVEAAALIHEDFAHVETSNSSLEH